MMHESNREMRGFKKYGLFNFLFIVVAIICILMFSFNWFLYYKTSLVSEAYAREAYERYRDRVMPVIENITMKELAQRKQEYENLDNRINQGFKEYLYTYYQLDSVIGRYSNVNASGLMYFAGRVQPIYFSKPRDTDVRINTGATIPNAIDTTMEYFSLSQNEEELAAYFHPNNRTRFNSVEEMVVASIYIHKDIMKLMDKELSKSHSFYSAIGKAGEYIDEAGYDKEFWDRYWKKGQK